MKIIISHLQSYTTLLTMNNNSPQSSTTSITRFLRHLLSPPRKPLTTTPSFSPPPPLSPNSDPDPDIHHQLFNYFDENGDGKISAAELQRRLKTVGMGELQLSDEEAEMAVRSSDADGDGALGLDDFEKMMKEGEEEEVKGAFVMYCDRKGSVITPKSLRKMMRRLGQPATVEDCKAMIGRFDGNGDGVLDYDEFRAMMSL